VNKVILVGYLSKDSEMKDGGKKVATGSIALNDWIGSTDQGKEAVEFIPFNAFGSTATTVANYAKRGRLVTLEGRLHMNVWDDPQTQTRKSRLEVIVNRVELYGGNGEKQKGGK